MIQKTSDPLLQRVLDMLYDEWFKYEELQPCAMWLAEFPASLSDGHNWFLHVGPNAKRAYFVEKIGWQEKTLCEWQRFYALSHVQPWNTSEFPHWPPLLRDGVFEIGFCWFAQDDEGKLEVAMTFGPRYGRGYLFAADGTVLDAWVS